jgi:hypothetical protein
MQAVDVNGMSVLVLRHRQFGSRRRDRRKSDGNGQYSPDCEHFEVPGSGWNGEQV